MTIGMAVMLTAIGFKFGVEQPDAAIASFVAYVKKNDVTLEKQKDGWWAVTDPKGDGYQVIVAFRAFPPGSTEEGMRATLVGINLAFQLNAPVRLAMSFAGLQITDPAKKPPKDVPAAVKLNKLFKEYRPPVGDR